MVIPSLFDEEVYWPPDFSVMGIFAPEEKPYFEWYLLGAVVALYLAIFLLVVVWRQKQPRLTGILITTLVRTSCRAANLDVIQVTDTARTRVVGNT